MNEMAKLNSKKWKKICINKIKAKKSSTELTPNKIIAFTSVSQPFLPRVTLVIYINIWRHP